MSRGAEMTEHQLEVPILEAETIRLARLTVAAHAIDARDCARLLDILGLRQQQAAAPVPIGEVRAVVERIQGGSDLSIREIGEQAGLNTTSLCSALTPSKAQKHVRRHTLLAVQRLAEELGV